MTQSLRSVSQRRQPDRWSSCLLGLFPLFRLSTDWRRPPTLRRIISTLNLPIQMSISSRNTLDHV